MAKQHHNSQPTLAEVSTSELTLEFQAHQPKSNQQMQREREREREGERERQRERERESEKFNSTIEGYRDTKINHFPQSLSSRHSFVTSSLGPVLSQCHSAL